MSQEFNSRLHTESGDNDDWYEVRRHNILQYITDALHDAQRLEEDSRQKAQEKDLRRYDLYLTHGETRTEKTVLLTPGGLPLRARTPVDYFLVTMPDSETWGVNLENTVHHAKITYFPQQGDAEYFELGSSGFVEHGSYQSGIDATSNAQEQLSLDGARSLYTELSALRVAPQLPAQSQQHSA